MLTAKEVVRYNRGSKDQGGIDEFYTQNCVKKSLPVSSSLTGIQGLVLITVISLQFRRAVIYADEDE